MRLLKPRSLGAALAALAIVGVSGATAAVVQDESVRVTFLARVSPYKLPRTGTAPISVSVTGHVEARDGGVPPQLRRMEIEVNRHGLLQSEGLPTCTVRQIRTATTQRALHNCGPALVGSGRFWAHIVLPDQEPYPSHGRILIFNGRQGARQQLLVHIFAASPFPSSFVIAFALQAIGHGRYGTRLVANLPQALGDWGYVDRIKLNLSRKYRFKGRELSYFNAGCPAPKQADRAAFPLARASFIFGPGKVVSGTVVKACGVKP
jgi:hypothetical protein